MNNFNSLNIYEDKNNNLVIAISAEDAAEFADSKTDEIVLRRDLNYMFSVISVDGNGNLSFENDELKATNKALNIIQHRIDEAIIAQATNSYGRDR